MSKLKQLFVKYLSGYVVNTVVVLVIAFILNSIFNTDIFDAFLICGAIIILFAFLTNGAYTRSMPAMSPDNFADTSEGYKGTGFVNTGAETLAGDKTNGTNGNEIKVKKINLTYYITNRSKIELISYSLIIILIGLIKYYSYF